MTFDSERPTRRRRVIGVLGAHPIVSSVVGIVVIAGGAFAFQQIRSVVAPPYRSVAFSVPTAPQLTAGAGETVYRIDPTRSMASYEIGERIFGASASVATARTNGIAGDLVLDRSDPSQSHVGEIVINVEQLTSDSSLRDARIRSDFLQSHQYSLSKFVTKQITGLPTAIEDGHSYDIELNGDLTVKATARPVTWTGTAKVVGDEVQVTVHATVKLSDFGVGPISIAGLVSTDDEAKLNLDVIAADPTKRTIPTEVPSLVAAAASGASPSFSKDIRPVLEQHCVACHTGGAVGSDVFKLETAADASNYASGISLVTRTKYMPPWPASTVGVPLQHPRNLSADTIDLLDRWAKAGGQLDVDGSTKLNPPADDPEATIRTDVVARMPEVYAGDGNQVNDYRCFVVDPGFTTPTYVTGYSFVPGTPKVVHHGLVYHVGAADKAELQARSGQDGRPGWQCFLGSGIGGGSPGAETNLFAGWVPGQRPIAFGTDQGFLFQPGDVIVMQVHYHYSGGVLGDQSELHLQTAPPKPGMHDLIVRNPIAPVDMPCPAGVSGPLCERSAALANLTKLYGPVAGGIPDAFIRMCGGPKSFTSDPVTGNGTATCDSRIHNDGNIVDVLGHMHTLGRTFRMTLNPGTPDEKVLLDIPSWNFDWQLNYQPVDPVPVKRGDVIRIDCSWDRSQRFDAVPRYILWSEGTEDEMCFSTYTISPTRTSG